MAERGTFNLIGGMSIIKSIEGIVCSGLGRGAGFLQINWLARELISKLGRRPFPGTFNLRVAPETREQFYASRSTSVKICDPSDGGCPGYLKAVALRAHGRHVGAFIIVPEHTDHADVLEIIAPVSLRDALAVSDGDVVRVEIP